MLARRGRASPIESGKMNLLQSAPPRTRAVIPRQQRLHFVVRQIFQRMKNQPAKHALREPFRRGINRRDPAEMNRFLLVVLDHFKLRMLHANALPAQPRLSENDQALAGRDHFLHVVQIEPAQHERLAERVRVRFLQGRFEDLLPAAETPQRRLRHLAANTDRRLAFLAREAGKLLPIFVPPRIMREQIAHRGNARAGATARDAGAAPIRTPRVVARSPLIERARGAERLHVHLQTFLAWHTHPT